ncbi:hypothetical protein BS50DRAFT_631243 [Corynespora cassiicola Philippines]|uniref:N-acetyltransferase domain-containing protein n=1 Tax=Corynespora cassiicola Philippines TaxID=1448308 RepID=A0A2T2P0U6_CORCC|nr:hypothetical protein BS50DRAFT_631243 [Corynespora cassiicola Philippines]
MTTTSTKSISTTTTPPKPQITLEKHTALSPSQTSKINTLLTRAFLTDPVTNYALHHLPPSARPAATHHLFRLSTSVALGQGAEIYTARLASAPNPPSPTPQDPFDPQTTALILPPGHSLDTPTPLTLLRILLNLTLPTALLHLGTRLFHLALALPRALAPPKADTFRLPGQKYFYVFQVATAAEHRGKGLAAEVLREVQGRAREVGCPVWIEASNEGARRLLAKNKG